MPFPLLAHQAIVLPLKLRAPRWFSGTALCIGSAIPDVEYLILDGRGGGAHEMHGQLLFCLPLTIATTFAVSEIVAPILDGRAAGRNASVSASFAARPRTALDAVRLVASALVGSGSHVWLDGMTHHRGWLAATWPSFDRGIRVFGVDTSGTRLLQYGLTIVLSLATLGVIARRATLVCSVIGRIARTDLLGMSAAAVIGCGIGTSHARPLVQDSSRYFAHAKVHVWGYVLFSACTFAVLAVVVACLLLRLRHLNASRFPYIRR